MNELEKELRNAGVPESLTQATLAVNKYVNSLESKLEQTAAQLANTQAKLALAREELVHISEHHGSCDALREYAKSALSSMEGKETT